MFVQLILEDGEGIPLSLSEITREAWLVQYERALQAGGLPELKKRLSRCVEWGLQECVDADLKPPTAAQLRYATSIARDVGVPLHAEALRFRGPMAEFIDRHVDAFNQLRQRRVPREDGPVDAD
jgi:hypothetical protein